MKVEAEIIEDDKEIAPIEGQMIVSVNLDGLKKRIAAMNEALASATQSAKELEVSDEALSEMDFDDVRSLATSLNKEVDACEKARKAFNGDYDTPKKAVKNAYDGAIEPVLALLERYKNRRTQLENDVKQGHFNALNDAYIEFMEGNGYGELAAAVPLEQFAESGWWNSVAKNFSERAATEKMTLRASEIIRDWNSLNTANLSCPDETRAEYLQTLDLGAALANDKRKAQEKQRVEALAAETVGNREYRDDSVVEEAQVEDRIEIPIFNDAPKFYAFTVACTEEQKRLLVNACKSLDIHGRPVPINAASLDQAVAIVKAVCSG